MNNIVSTLLVFSAARAVPAIISLVITFLSIQSLNNQEYGVYTLALLPIMMAASFSGGLAGQPLMRYGSELSINQLKIGLIYLPSTVAVLTLPFLFTYFILINQSWYIIFCAILIVPVISLLDTYRGYLISTEQAVRILIMDTVRSIMILMTLVLILNLGYNEGFAPLLAFLLGNSCALIFIKKKASKPFNQGTRLVDKNYVQYGIWVALWMIISGFFPLIERLILANRYNLSEAGVYASMADPVSAVLSATGGILVSATMPRYISAWNTKQIKKMQQLMLLSLLVIFITSLVCLIIGLIVVQYKWGRLASVLEENTYAAIILLTAYSVWQFSIFVHKPIELIGKTRLMFHSLLISILVFIILTYLLLPYWGLVAISSSKLIAGFIYIYLVHNYVLKISDAVK